MQKVEGGNKMQNLVRVFSIAAICVCGVALANDADTANALAKGGTKLISEGKIEKGKDMMYKALANDENCGEALYELGKLLEAEGKNATAADFYNRASVILGEKNDAPSITKKNDATTRLKKLNPYATRFTAAMAEYAAGLETIHKKIPDSMTRDEAQAHVDALKLSKILTPDQMPKIEKPAPVAKNEDDDFPALRRNPTTGRLESAPVAKSVVPPDVERALKASGWKTITGVWKLKSPNVYEVTDGKLEADYKNGMMQVTVYKGGTGAVGAMVRDAYGEYRSLTGFGDRPSSYASGFGWIVKGSNAYRYGSTGWGYTSAGVAEPYLDTTEALPDANPKNTVMVSVQDNLIETTINGAKNRKGNVKISQEGGFRVQISGTMTIEAPGARGR